MTLPSSGPLSLSDIQGEFGGSNPIGMNEYYAGGGLVPSGTTGTYGAVPTSGQISVQNFYGTSNYIPVYIETLFSTWLYAGNSSNQTITNNINLSGSGGLIWLKDRTSAGSHCFFDTARGADNLLQTNQTNAQVNSVGYMSTFNSNGFSLVSNYPTNISGDNYVSWSFQKQSKFFDIVTYTGTGANRTISHNLGATPGCIIVKRTDTTSNWQVYHNGLTSAAYSIQLNLTNAQASATTVWNSTAPTSTVFSVGTDSTVNASGGTYVAYLFAHNAGGFGATGTSNVISCGSFTTNGSGNATVNLGYEPQWIMYKSSSLATNWTILDNMRGMSVTSNSLLSADSNSAETTSSYPVQPTATGFQAGPSPLSPLAYNQTYIYIAIRRGPMKVPTVGTSVFSPNAVNVPQGTKITSGFRVDMTMPVYRSNQGPRAEDRLRGISTSTSDSTTEYYLTTSSTAAESNSLGFTYAWDNTGFLMNAGYANAPDVFWSFQRAPGFFDEVCWTGNGGFDQTVTHNLGVIPTLLITKIRNASGSWKVIVDTGSGAYPCVNMYLNDTSASTGSSTNQGTSTTCVPLSSTGYGDTYVTYLFATCAGVSKVGSYTGTGATQTISCGFTGGARWVMVKRTDSTGDWYVWDTARGMVSGTDPSLAFNLSTAEVNANSVYTTTGGFQIVSTAAGINASGGTYIFLAIA